MHKDPEIVRELRREETIKQKDKLDQIDITENFAKEEGEKFNQILNNLIIDNINQGILIVQDQMIKFCNSHLNDLTGYSFQEFSSKPFIHFLYPDDQKIMIDYHLKINTGEDVSDFIQCRFINKNGDIRWIKVNAVVINWKDHPAILDFVLDITKEKKAEERLKGREEKYRTIFENVIDEIVFLDKYGKIIDVNPISEKFFGRKLNDLIGKKFSDLGFFPKKDIPKILKFFNTSIIEKKPLVIKDQVILNSEGKEVITDVHLRSILKNGNIESIFALVRNVTVEKHSERKIKEFEERYRSLFDRSMDLIFITDFKGNFIDANPACFNLLGYSKDGIKKVNYSTLLDKGQLLKALKVARVTKRDGFQKEPTEFKLKCKNGEFVYVETLSSVIYHNCKPVALQGIARDITQRKKTEAELEKLATVIKYSSELVNLATLDGKMIFINDAGSKMLGINTDDVQNHEIFEVIPDELLHKVKNEVVKSILRDGYWEGDLSYKNILTEKITDVHAITFIIKDPKSKKPLYLANVSRDITEKKKVEKKIRESEKKLRNIINHSDGVFYIHDCNHNLIYVSPQSKKIFGYNPEEMMLNWTNLITENPINEKGFEITNKAIETGEKQDPYILEAIRKDGGKILVKINESPLKDDSENIIGITGMLSDVTKEMKAEEELKFTHDLLKTMNEDLEKIVIERTADVEKLLTQKDGFIHQLGHDLKNPLVPLINLLPLLEKQEENPKNKEIFKVINRNVEYMKNLVTKTIDLAKLNSPNTIFNFENTDLLNEFNKVIEQNKLLFEDNNIIVRNNLSENIIVQADKLRLAELLNNLVINSVKYSKEVGFIKLHAIEDDLFVTISIEDNGIGMTRGTLEKVFDEFYKADTSRHDFDSSGLGMPICRRIVEKHGGHIWAESPGLDHGSTFYFTLKKGDVQKKCHQIDKREFEQNKYIQLIKHQGKEILYFDYSNIDDEGYKTAHQDIRNYIIKLGKRDLLVLTNINNDYINIESMKIAKKTSDIVGSYLKKNAIIGIPKSKRIFLKAIQLFSNIDMKEFESIKEAKDWLIKD